MTIHKLFLSFLGTGLSPKYPEIVATLLSSVLGFIILRTMGMETLFMLILAVGIVGIFEINKSDNPHSPEIVIDDAVGVWLALLVPHMTALSLSCPYALELSLFFSFLSFRLFAIWRPSTIGWIQKNVKGGLGVIGSAALAGFAGGFLTILILLGIAELF